MSTTMAACSTTYYLFSYSIYILHSRRADVPYVDYISLKIVQSLGLNSYHDSISFSQSPLSAPARDRAVPFNKLTRFPSCEFLPHYNYNAEVMYG